MHSFYTAGEIAGKTVSISDPDQVHHIRDVLRLKSGEEVTLFDSQGREYSAIISAFEKKQVKLSVISRRAIRPKRLIIAVACAIPKQARLDDIIDKLTQLGIDRIIPMETERVIVKRKENSRLERWRKIARSSAEQSHRNTLPDITRVLGFAEVLKQSQGYELKLISTLEGRKKTLKEIIADSRPDSIFVLIGPEGDFTFSEIELAKEAGFMPVSLGESVLRVDAAAIAIASYLKLALME